MHERWYTFHGPLVMTAVERQLLSLKLYSVKLTNVTLMHVSFRECVHVLYFHELLELCRAHTPCSHLH